MKKIELNIDRNGHVKTRGNSGVMGDHHAILLEAVLEQPMDEIQFYRLFFACEDRTVMSEQLTLSDYRVGYSIPAEVTAMGNIVMVQLCGYQMDGNRVEALFKSDTALLSFGSSLPDTAALAENGLTDRLNAMLAEVEQFSSDFDLTVSQVTTLPAGSSATARVNRSGNRFSLELGIPGGQTGGAMVVYTGSVDHFGRLCIIETRPLAEMAGQVLLVKLPQMEPSTSVLFYTTGEGAYRPIGVLKDGVIQNTLPPGALQEGRIAAFYVTPQGQAVLLNPYEDPVDLFVQERRIPYSQTVKERLNVTTWKARVGRVVEMSEHSGVTVTLAGNAALTGTTVTFSNRSLTDAELATVNQWNPIYFHTASAGDGITYVQEIDTKGATEYFVQNYSFLKNGNTANLHQINATVVGSNAVALNAATATGEQSFASGLETQAVGSASHTEGTFTEATGSGAHAEGGGSQAMSPMSHAEGDRTVAGNSSDPAQPGGAAHAEGGQTQASGTHSHAEGYMTVASGEQSHAGGFGTIAAGNAQTAIGQYNVADTTSLFIVGNGTGPTSRANAFTVGNGFVKIGSTTLSEIDLQRLLMLI